MAVINGKCGRIFLEKRDIRDWDETERDESWEERLRAKWNWELCWDKNEILGIKIEKIESWMQLKAMLGAKIKF